MVYTRTLLPLLVILFFTQITFGQLNTKSVFKKFVKTIDFPFEELKDPNQEYPQLRVEGNDVLVDIVQLQGIQMSYIIDYDKWEDGNLTTTSKDEDWYIDLILENTTNKDIYYDNPDDVVAVLKVPGERTYYDNLKGNEIRVSGGKCIFYAWMLEDKENGKYVLRANDEYEWDYVVNRDAESYFETWVQRRFRPLEASVSIPVGAKQDIGTKNDLIAYRETVSPNDIENVTYGNYSTSSVKLPKKRVFLSTGYPKCKSKHTFKKNGDWLLVYEDDAIKLELKQLTNDGLFEYRLTNMGLQDLKMDNDEPIGLLTISNSHVEEIYLAKKNSFVMQKLPSKSAYSKQFTALLNPISGEYWVNNHKIEPRKTMKRDFVPTSFKLRNIMGAKTVENTGGSNTIINILYPLNSETKYNPGKFYFEDAQKHLMHKGQIYTVEISKQGEVRWITFDTDYNGFTYPPNKIEKWLGDKPGLMKSSITYLNAQPGQVYYFVLVNTGISKLQSVTKEEWNKYLKNSNMVSNPTPEVIKK